MRFRDWFLSEDVYDGGNLQNFPGQNLNTGLPVASKISTKDGSDKIRPDAADGQKNPDAVFGFRSPMDKNRTRERRPNWIDTDRRRAPVSSAPPETIN